MAHRGIPAGRSVIARARRHRSWLIALVLLALSMPHAAWADDPRDRYIVVLEASVERPAAVAAEHQRRYGGELTHVYDDALNGYAAELPQRAAASIARDPRVTSVELDQTVAISAADIPTGIRRIGAPTNPGMDIDATDDVRVDVDVAILDTGIDPDHPDLNVVGETNCTGTGSLGGCVEGTGRDDNGHGTHVAGTVAAIDNDFGVVGVAPGARLHAVKVLAASGDGFVSDVIAGVDWVTSRATTIEVVNMSLGCRCSVLALDEAIAASVDAGVVYVVAAGNSHEDAIAHSPASHPDVITVSAIADFDGVAGGRAPTGCRADRDDTLADFSNWGPSVEIAAPGTCIWSTSNFGGYETMSGTSMASPHVAGAAAVLASGANNPRDRADVEMIRELVTQTGNFTWVDDSGDGVTEPLLDVSDAGVYVVNSHDRTPRQIQPPSSPNESPLATFAHSCSGLTCDFDARGSSDPDGTISSVAWDFGDGTNGSGPTVTKRFDASGSYQVTVTVTDDREAAATDSETITVSSGSTGGGASSFQLVASGVRTEGRATILLEWYGTDKKGSVVIYRDGVIVATTPDDGSYTEVIEGSSGRITYRICEEGTVRCSNESRVF